MKFIPTFVLASLTTALCFAPSDAQANTLIFSENFETAVRGIPSLDIGQFTVQTGTVDVIPVNRKYDLEPIHGGLLGKYLDMDGTGAGLHPVDGSNGTILTPKFTFTPGDYILSFDLAGSQGRSGNNANANGLYVFALLSDGITEIPLQTFIPPDRGLFVNMEIHRTLLASFADVRLGFRSIGRPDNQGVLLDNVSIFRTPDGGLTAAFLGLSMAGLALVRRKFTVVV